MLHYIHTTPLFLVAATDPMPFDMNFPAPKFGSCEHIRNRSNARVLHLSWGYSKAILIQPQGEQDIVVRTGVGSENHLEWTSAQVKAHTDNTIGYSIWCFVQLNGPFTQLLPSEEYWYCHVRWKLYPLLFEAQPFCILSMETSFLFLPEQ